MPAKQQQELLNVLNDLHEDAVAHFSRDANISEVHKMPCPLPKELRTIVGRASPQMILDAQISYRVLNLSTHLLNQQQVVVHVYIGDLPNLLQSMFLDPRFNWKQFFLQPNTIRRSYTTENGHQVFGPELYHGTRWAELERTIPEGGRGLMLIFSSDKTVSLRGNQYPFCVQVGNFAYNDRNKAHGSQIFALGPKINIYRQGKNIIP